MGRITSTKRTSTYDGQRPTTVVASVLTAAITLVAAVALPLQDVSVYALAVDTDKVDVSAGANNENGARDARDTDEGAETNQGGSTDGTEESTPGSPRGESGSEQVSPEPQPRPEPQPQPQPAQPISPQPQPQPQPSQNTNTRQPDPILPQPGRGGSRMPQTIIPNTLSVQPRSAVSGRTPLQVQQPLTAGMPSPQSQPAELTAQTEGTGGDSGTPLEAAALTAAAPLRTASIQRGATTYTDGTLSQAAVDRGNAAAGVLAALGALLVAMSYVRKPAEGWYNSLVKGNIRIHG